MSENEKVNKRGCGSPVVMFFILAAACVIAFLIVLLVKSCDADHEEKKMEQIEQNDVVMIQPTIETRQLS